MAHKPDKRRDTERRDPYSASFLCNRCAWRSRSFSLSLSAVAWFKDWFLVYAHRDCSSQGLLLFHASSLRLFKLFIFFQSTNVEYFSSAFLWNVNVLYPAVVWFVLTTLYNPSFPSAIQIATELDGQTVAMSTSSLRRQVKNIVHNYSEAEIKVVCPSAHLAFLLLLLLSLCPSVARVSPQHRWHNIASDNLIFPWNNLFTHSFPLLRQCELI